MKKILFIVFVYTLTSMISKAIVYAETTGPRYFLYEGQLAGADGNAFFGEFDFRFSFWNSPDFTEDDVIKGAINADSGKFLNWQESHRETVNNGAFSIKIGETIPFPENVFRDNNVYLQVEVKYKAEGEEMFELIDANPLDEAHDRMLFGSVPFAENANKLDFRDAGYNAGDIPYLDDAGKLPRALIDAGFGPGDIPYLDENAELPRDVIKTGYEAGDIPYLDENGELPRSVINAGYDPGDIPYLDERAKLPRDLIDAGFDPGDIPYLNEDGKLQKEILETGFQPYDIPTLDDTGKISPGLIPDLYIGSGNIITGFTVGKEFTIDSEGFALPTDTLTLKFGRFLAKTLSWSGLLQRFIFSDTVQVKGGLIVDGPAIIDGVEVGQHEESKVLTPSYPGAIYEEDGTDNLGSMYGDSIDGVGNAIRWSTRQTALQDYDVNIRYVLPREFVKFSETGDHITLKYKTMGAAAKSRIDFTLKREGDAVEDEFSGSGINLMSNEWTEVKFTLPDTAKWQVGDVLLMKIKLFSSQGFDSSISDIQIKTISK